MFKRTEQAGILKDLEIAKRGTIKIASSALPGDKIAVSQTDVQKALSKFDHSPDVSKKTLEQYKQRAQFSDKPDEVAKEFFTDFDKARSLKKKMSIITAKCLRQTGCFKIAGRDVYEDLATGDFWKISEDKKHVIRLFKENEKGISNKRASSSMQSLIIDSLFDVEASVEKQEYTIMGKKHGDGGSVFATSFEDAAAEFFSQEGEYSKEEVLHQIKHSPFLSWKQVSDKEVLCNDYEIKLGDNK